MIISFALWECNAEIDEFPAFISTQGYPLSKNVLPLSTNQFQVLNPVQYLICCTYKSLMDSGYTVFLATFA